MNDLLRLLPPIRRARGNRLYAADGRRFLDLWLDDGRGILGERDRATRTMAANAADKGLTRPYPGLYDARFAKAVIAAWPGFGTVKTFSCERAALDAAARVLGAAPRVIDAAAPLSDPGAGPTLALARPFAAIPESADVAMPRLPCPRPYSPYCLMARDGTPAAASLGSEPGELVPAQSTFAAARGLSSLESAVRDGYGEELWARFDKRLGAFFARTGPYLFARVDAGSYDGFFRAALEGGALVSPRFDAPSVIPPDFDDGELVKLLRALEKLALR